MGFRVFRPVFFHPVIKYKVTARGKWMWKNGGWQEFGVNGEFEVDYSTIFIQWLQKGKSDFVIDHQDDFSKTSNFCKLQINFMTKVIRTKIVENWIEDIFCSQFFSLFSKILQIFSENQIPKAATPHKKFVTPTKRSDFWYDSFIVIYLHQFNAMKTFFAKLFSFYFRYKLWISCQQTTYSYGALHFARIFLATTIIYTHNVETKVVRNVIENIFCTYTFLPRGCYFRVVRVNVKFGSTCQSKKIAMIFRIMEEVARRRWYAGSRATITSVRPDEKWPLGAQKSYNPTKDSK